MNQPSAETAVSVLMPVYNAERFLAEAIESVLKQTFTNFEFIIANDGSTDQTLEIINHYASIDGRIRVISRPNKGLANCLNYALEFTSNDWVVCMHADDVMVPDRLKRQIDFITQNPDVAVASSFVYYINENGEEIGKYKSQLITREKVLEQFEKNKMIGFHHPAVIMRKSVVMEVGGYRQEFFPAEDVDLWNRITEHGYSILVQPEYLLKYRIHAVSSSIARMDLIVQKANWVTECLINRRSGKEELTWEEFLTKQKQMPILRWINQKRKDTSRIFYKKAVFQYSRKNYPSCFSILLGATMLSPVLTINMVISKYGKPRVR